MRKGNTIRWKKWQAPILPDSGGKQIIGLLFIYPEGFDSEADMDFWAGKALEFNKVAEASRRK
jgi:queuine/archaeosine tRNA-ribosyltransferase